MKAAHSAVDNPGAVHAPLIAPGRAHASALAVALALAVPAAAAILVRLVQPWSAVRERVELPVPACDLAHEVCAVPLDAGVPNGARVLFSMTPRPIVPSMPLDLEARFEGIAPERVEVDLNGTAMRMVDNRTVLRAGADGRYVGRTGLSACITGGMQWRAALIVDDGRTQYTLPFVFDTPAGGR